MKRRNRKTGAGERREEYRGNEKMKLLTRRMDEMTGREIELYFEKGGDLVFIPFGPISGHGAFIPVGIHGLWAGALSLLIAEKADGLVYPIVNTCYAGATRSFRGTVSFTITEQAEFLTNIALSLLEQGFKRIVLVAATTPEHTGGYIAAREIFNLTGKPVWFLIAENLLNAPEVRAIYEGYPGNFGETLLCLASMRILGRERPIPCPEWARELKEEEYDQPEAISSDLKELRKWGTAGFRYYDEKNHGNHGTAGIICNGVHDIDLTVDVLKKCADIVLSAHFSSFSGLNAR